MIRGFEAGDGLREYFRTRHPCISCNKMVVSFDESLGKELLTEVKEDLGMNLGGEFTPTLCLQCLVETTRCDAETLQQDGTIALVNTFVMSTER